MGIDVVGESQLVGYKSQFPSVSMMNYSTAEPNPRYWVLKLLKDHFGPGDKLVETSLDNSGITAQGFETKVGKALLVINKRDRVQDVDLPADAVGASVLLVAPSTKDHAAAEVKLQDRALHLEPFEVAIVHWK